MAVGQQLPADTGQMVKSSQDFPVVAIGASAGGLEVFTELLRHLPADTGMAFVFIQHLAPRHASMLAQLLSRETAMPVKEVADGAVLSPNHVYVIPPNAAMTVSGLALALKPRGAAGTAIDAFLRSLSVCQKARAVAVILSGTGSDGALGVQAIAEEGGIVIAQDPASAKFDSMPRSAIATGCVDFVLPPEAIATELARIAREPNLALGDVPEHGAQSSASEKDFQAVLGLLRAGTGIDFSLYRLATVKRRMLRRLGLLRQASLREYLEYVKQNPDEVHALSQDILIRVTRFFRDPEVFEALSRRVFPALIRKTPQDRSVRVWAAGCSTGEEAYSIAMCFLEVAEQMQSRISLQVFATDINESAIEKARRGAYIENIAADVSPERLRRFFVRAGRGFEVSRSLRDLCIFSRHDLLNDPPFSRIDLITCRNVLIYLDSMQEHAFSRFHFALNPGGFLLLGKSEAATSSPELFAPLDKEARLYARQDAARRPAFAHANRKKAVAHPAQELVSAEAGLAHRIDLRRQAERILVERYSPPRMIVNGNLEAVGWGGEAVARASAPDIQNQVLLEVVKKGEAAALRNAIRTAAKTGRSARTEQVKLGEGSATGEVDIEVTPLGPDTQHFLIVFEQCAGPGLEPGESPAGGKRRKVEARVDRLGKELASSRAHLESVIVEQEAAHEEVIAANEELQSLNEELESSKEELEAVNEELTTVNQELQVRNTELDNAREFAQATIDTVRGALVVLGPDLRVLNANHSFYRTFRLSAPEVEHRFIYEVGDGQFASPRLRVLLEETLPESRSTEDFEMEHDSPSGGTRILLLNARRFEHEQRVLLAIEDVTEKRHAEEELRQSQKMEAIGYLAAGVAHDFNNLMTSVIGNATMLYDNLPENDPGRSALQNVITGGERAADLTRQLLAYAGKGRFFLERVDLSDVVIQTGKLIHSSIAPNVQLRLDLDKHLPRLLADPGQMQQVVMNLMINGAEAIGSSGGIVQVRTGTQTVTDERLPDVVLNQRVVPGSYVFLEVQDNGSGMDEQTMQRIFDPFFSTKFTGRGLGLAAVMGIVRQHKAAVQVHSVPGRGSSFRVLFSAGEEAPAPIAEDVRRAELRGAGTVLVVDNDEVIRKLSKAALESYGYSVLLARNGQGAVGMLQETSDDIKLVLLEVEIPAVNGLEVMKRIREVRPDVPVMVCSGCGDQEIETLFEGSEVAGFLSKPFTVKQLAKTVKDSMRQPERPIDLGF